MKEECLNCLQSTIGFCELHAPKYEKVSFTTTTREYTRTEKFNELIRWACKLAELKWYQSKRTCIKMIKYWNNELKERTN